MKRKNIIWLLLLLLLCSCHHIITPTDSHPAAFSESTSSDNICAMQLDGYGYLWIGTDRGVNIYDGTNYRLLQHDKTDTTTLRSNNVINLYKDPGDTMWVMTDDGIDQYEGRGIFRHYNSNAALHTANSMVKTHDGKVIALFGNELCQLTNGSFRNVCRLLGSYTDGDRAYMYESGDGRLLVNTTAGAFIISKDLRHFKPIPIKGSVIACADKDNICIVSFEEGIYFLDRKNLKVKYHTGKRMQVVAENVVLWRGRLIMTGYDGMYVLNTHTGDFSPLPQNIQDAVHPQFIQRLYVDDNGVLWLGYDHIYKIKKINSLSELQHDIWKDKAYSIFKRHGVAEVAQDNRGNIFGALDNDSIFYIDKASNRILLSALNATIPVHSRQHVLSVNYSAGHFWVVTTSNVFAFQCNDGIQLKEFYDIGLFYTCMCGNAVPVHNGLAVLCSNDLIVFDAVNKTSIGAIQRFVNGKQIIWSIGNFGVKAFHIDNSKLPLGSHLINIGNNKVIAAFQDYRPWEISLINGKVKESPLAFHANIICSVTSGNHTFIGTDNGLYIYDSNTGRLSKATEFADKPINNIMATADGIILTCEGDILAFDPTTRHINKIWQGSPQKDFQPNTLVQFGKQKLFAATREGFRQYEIMRKGKDEVLPKLYIEGLDVVMSNNTHKSCSLFYADSTTTVALNHDENTINIAYAAITPSMSGKYTFRYRLKGYNDNWEYSDNSGNVEYAKVRPGKYRFEITCTDQQRPWITVSRSLTVRVKPHPLLSWAAISIYVIVILIAIFFANRLYIRMRMVRMNHDNAAFFYNISHEFRNPITMIAGPVSMLRKAPELSKQSANMVRLISQSAKMLMKLADQMLDFNLLDGEALRLSVSRIDVAAIISEYSRHYEVSAAEKEIHINNIGFDSPVLMLADEDKIIKIFDNIMSNAVKHTPQGGTITVKVETTDFWLTLSVENTGSHIPKDWDTGVGLHYVKSLVTLHHGSISATNTDNGVLITVSLPMDEKFYSAGERMPRTQKQEDTTAFEDDDILRPRQIAPANGSKRRTLLFVEKDVNTAYFLRKVFENEYNVVNRYDAEAVLHDMADIKPDIIVSCVMLNGKSGIELCQELHANEQYKDIPFIFLTTCDSGDQKAEGMRAGADAYVTKPFEPEYLREVIKKALDRADSYRQLLSQLPQQQKETAVNGLSAKDKETLRIIRKFMKDNISDGDLNVDKLGRKLLLSRTKLYEKIKELTGKTPNELFRTYKLTYAASLLKEGKLNVSEVAERSGFSSIAFFSRTFKKYYGVSPKDYD